MHRKNLFSHQCSKSVSTACCSVFQKKKDQCEDVERSQTYKGEDPNASKALQQDEELSFSQANRFTLSMARCLGFHNVRRGSNGELELSPWRIVPLLVHLTISVAGLLVLLYLFIFGTLKYYQAIMISPIAFGMAYCVNTYISTVPLSKYYLKYLSTIEAQEVRVVSSNNMCGVTGIFVSAVYTACSLLVTNLPQEYLLVLLVPVFTTSNLPTFLEIHMFSFNLMLKQQLIKLRHHIRRVKQWTRDEVSGVARQWLLLCRLFRLHNKVRLLPIRLPAPT